MTDEIRLLCETAHRWHEEIKTCGNKTMLTEKDLQGLHRRIEKAQEAYEKYNVAVGVAQKFIDEAGW